MRLKFELVQPGEYDDYYYNIIGNGNLEHGKISFNKEWRLTYFMFCSRLNADDIFQVANKLDELNAATKADKLFGFL